MIFRLKKPLQYADGGEHHYFRKGTRVRGKMTMERPEGETVVMLEIEGFPCVAIDDLEPIDDEARAEVAAATLAHPKARSQPRMGVTSGMAGHFAVLYDAGGDCPGEPTGVGRYATEDEAWEEARAWAEVEGVPLDKRG